MSHVFVSQTVKIIKLSMFKIYLNGRVKQLRKLLCKMYIIDTYNYSIVVYRNSKSRKVCTRSEDDLRVVFPRIVSVTLRDK